jgi:GAF domain-containing protein
VDHADDVRLPAVGTRLSLGGRDLHTLVFQTGRPARIDDYSDASPQAIDIARTAGVRSAAGAPIGAEAKLWGVIGVSSRHELPPDTEERLDGFAELLATAIANAEARAALIASRVRIVASADAARRRIERDLHDGAQQRLVPSRCACGPRRRPPRLGPWSWRSSWRARSLRWTACWRT